MTNGKKSGYEIEALTLVDWELDDNGTAQGFEYIEYLVKRSSDGCPIAQFKTLEQARDFIRELGEY